MYLRNKKTKFRVETSRKAVSGDKRHKEAQCDGKNKYESFGAAERAVKFCKNAGPTKIYRCNFCRFWHAGFDRTKQFNSMLKPRPTTFDDGDDGDY